MAALETAAGELSAGAVVPPPAWPGVAAAVVAGVEKGSTTGREWPLGPPLALPSSSLMRPSSWPTRALLAFTTSSVLPRAWAGMARIWLTTLKGVGPLPLGGAPPGPGLLPCSAHWRALGFRATRAK